MVDLMQALLFSSLRVLRQLGRDGVAKELIFVLYDVPGEDYFTRCPLLDGFGGLRFSEESLKAFSLGYRS